MIDFAIILAAGSGERFYQSQKNQSHTTTPPKAFITLGDKPLYQHSLDVITPKAKKVFLVIPRHLENPTNSIENNQIECIRGGKSRQESVQLALQKIAKYHPLKSWVCIHDAARALLHPEDLTNLIAHLPTRPLKSVGAILVTEVNDTLKREVIAHSSSSTTFQTLQRKEYFLSQTPQIVV